jgi:hypothetical protein
MRWKIGTARNAGKLTALAAVKQTDPDREVSDHARPAHLPPIEQQSPRSLGAKLSPIIAWPVAIITFEAAAVRPR